MNWITTNIRLPEEIYMELKMQAARERRSIATIIRERLSGNKKEETKQTLQAMKDIGKKIHKENKGLNLAKSLIEMRYEQ